jgi:hypothetical protein
LHTLSARHVVGVEWRHKLHGMDDLQRGYFGIRHALGYSRSHVRGMHARHV